MSRRLRQNDESWLRMMGRPESRSRAVLDW